VRVNRRILELVDSSELNHDTHKNRRFSSDGILRICQRMKCSLGLVTLLQLVLCVPVSNWAQEVATEVGATATLEQEEFFEKSIRPLLAENCHQCHSSSVDVPFGGLRLDSRSGLLTGGDSGPALIPGRSNDSAIIQRVQGRPGLMPPTGRLDDEEIEALVRWVDMGAPWPVTRAFEDIPDPSAPFDLAQRKQRHWAWQPIQVVDPPTINDPVWTATPVDRFVYAALDNRSLEPAPAVGRYALIRRLSFDLRGLPPTPMEVARFVANESPAAYEALVDRYLASPQFGERWARHWMDLVRYSESHGSEGDPDIPYAWRYRDYLIRAFNTDVPYDQLIREHLAGDLLAPPRLNSDLQLNESVLGTAHFRLVEHGYQPVDPWEDRVKWTDNQVDVVSKAFMGLTVSCAKCHDHKFDAISQKDYYSLFGTLYGARPTQRAIDAPRVLATNTVELAKLKQDIRLKLGDVWMSEVAELSERLLEQVKAPAATDPDRLSSSESVSDGNVLEALHTLEGASDFKRAWRELRDAWVAERVDRERFNADHFDTAWDFASGDYSTTVGHGVGRPDVPSAPGEFSVERRGDLLLRRIYPGGVYTHLLSTKHGGVIQTPRFRIDSDYISLRVLGGDLSFAQVIIENYAVPRGGIYHLRYSPKADEMAWAQWDATFWKGFTAYIEFATQDDVTRFQYDSEDAALRNRPTRREDGRSFIGASQIVFHDKKVTPRDTVLPVLHMLKVDDPMSLEDLVVSLRRQVEAAVEAWRGNRLSESQAVFLDEFVRADLLSRSLEDLPTLRPLVAEYRLLERDVPVARRAPGVVEEAAPNQPLLVRGSHKNLGDVVPRGFLTAINDQVYPEPAQVRLHLADAVTASDNPLTARVAVNRVWRYLFGYGLVRTVDNFGRLGDLPSHPGLLDYLAQNFIGDGYSVKRLIRRLVLTNTYQLSSSPSAASTEIDPTNRLLQHANLRRLDAEAIRDAMLAISGRLDSTMYGPSVPVHYAARRGLTEGDPDNGPVDGDGRRSVYQEIRRNAHNPFLEVFDLPKPATTRGQRDATNVPAQSLALLNSPLVVGQAAEWGRRLANGEPTSVDGRVTHMFLKTLTRHPTDVERARVNAYISRVAATHGTSPELLMYGSEVWQDVAHSLFNLKEFIFIP